MVSIEGSSRSAPGDAVRWPNARPARCAGPCTALNYGFVVFLTSTLLPITPPRMAPAAPPITAPFTLFLLVTAPMTAPAPAPIAASRLVFFCTVVVGVLAFVVVPLLAVLLAVECDVVELDLWVVELEVDLGAAAAVVPLRIADVPVAAFDCSAALTESSGVFACAARPRSLLSD